jgi:hypothetical protein
MDGLWVTGFWPGENERDGDHGRFECAAPVGVDVVRSRTGLAAFRT